MANENTYPDINFLRQMAFRADETARGKQDFKLFVRSKSDGTPVSAVDELINTWALQELGDKFPHASCLFEEESKIVNGSHVQLIGDPIDGTASFLRGLPGSTFCLGSVVNGISTTAIIHEFGIRKFDCSTWTAERGIGAWCDNRPIKVSKQGILDGAYIDFVWWPSNNLISFERLTANMNANGISHSSVRATAWSTAQVASGRLDGFISPTERGWEVAAIQGIVQAAGGEGVVTDLAGQPLVFASDGSIGNGFVVSNGLIHDKLLDIVGRSRM